MSDHIAPLRKARRCGLNRLNVLRRGIKVGPYGRFLTAGATESALAEAGLV